MLLCTQAFDLIWIITYLIIYKKLKKMIFFNEILTKIEKCNCFYYYNEFIEDCNIDKYISNCICYYNKYI